jgi:hypothetical protein
MVLLNRYMIRLHAVLSQGLEQVYQKEKSIA